MDVFAFREEIISEPARRKVLRRSSVITRPQIQRRH